LLAEGQAFERAGQLEHAERRYRQALGRDPALPAALHQLALLLRSRGHLHEATAALQRLVDTVPGDALAWVALAEVCRAGDDTRGAAAAYRKALALEPDNPRVAHDLAVALTRLEHGDAVDAWRRAVALRPDSAAEHNGLGFALMLSGQLAEARAALRQALALDANLAPAHSNLGTAYLDGGDFAAAEACYRRALVLEPRYGEALLGLSRCRRFRPEERAELERFEALVNQPDVSAEARCDMHYALGKLLDDCAAYREAFAHYRAANALQGARFDGARHAALAGEIIETFSGEFLAGRSGWGSASERPLFVLGMPRSGTTLVEQILASHPQVHGGGERPEIPALAARLAGEAGAGYARAVAALDSAGAARLAEEYLATLLRLDAQALRVTDKLPANFLYLGLIATILPRARIIHCERDPRDICLSIYFQKFAPQHEYACRLEDIADYYRAYRRLIAHFRAHVPNPWLDVAYESVVAAPEREARRLIAFCDLPWDRACAHPERTERLVQTASNWQVRQPVYRQALARWRHYAELAPELAPVLALAH
jgi:tetratricopeptide (TPR) repeat protein